MYLILFKNYDDNIYTIIPVNEVLNVVGIEAIARKDVPAGCPYWIVDSSTLPNTPQETWTIDENEFPPHGYGGESSEFTPEELAQLANKGVISVD